MTKVRFVILLPHDFVLEHVYVWRWAEIMHYQHFPFILATWRNCYIHTAIFYHAVWALLSIHICGPTSIQQLLGSWEGTSFQFWSEDFSRTGGKWSNARSKLSQDIPVSLHSCCELFDALFDEGTGLQEFLKGGALEGRKTSDTALSQRWRKVINHFKESDVAHTLAWYG